MNKNESRFIEERHKEILEKLEQNGRISTSEIQLKYNISVDSARRDLRILEQRGLLQRTYGGAISVKPNAFYPEKDYNPPKITDVKENYLKIALKAIEMIKPKEVIFITSGSLGYFMVQNLPKNFEFTVVTNSVIIAHELINYENVSCILAGGEMTRKGHFTDIFALDILKRINIDKAFLTAAAISIQAGATIQKAAAVGIAECVMKQSTMTIGLFPSEKVGKESILSIASVEQFDMIITDENADMTELNKMEELGVNIEIVDL